MKITQKTLARSALVGLFMTIEGMVLQVGISILLDIGVPPGLGHIIGVTACYFAASFTSERS